MPLIVGLKLGKRNSATTLPNLAMAGFADGFPDMENGNAYDPVLINRGNHNATHLSASFLHSL